MNLSIYIRLWIANVFGKVKIRPKYKHLGFLKENRYISPKLDESAKPTPEPGPYLKDWYVITCAGKQAYWTKGDLLFTRILSIIAILISAAALAISFFM